MALVDFKLGDIGNLFTSAREAITGKKILDPNEMAKIEFQLSQLEHLANQGQIEVNKIEAAHKSLFVAGWRPFIGWVCGVALAYAYVGQPIFEWVIAINGLEIKAPEIDTDTLYQLVLAMLGMATLRTYEKSKNVQREK